MLADCSATVTYDVLRNQLARTIDVMLDQQPKLTAGLESRYPDLSCFVLLTPELYRQHPRSRLYGWLLKEYRKRPLAIREDLPHRKKKNPTGAPSRNEPAGPHSKTAAGLKQARVAGFLKRCPSQARLLGFPIRHQTEQFDSPSNAAG